MSETLTRTITTVNIEEMADEVIKSEKTLTTIDGGDHVINIWVNDDGEEIMMIQGTGDKATLIK